MKYITITLASAQGAQTLKAVPGGFVPPGSSMAAVQALGVSGRLTPKRHTQTTDHRGSRCEVQQASRLWRLYGTGCETSRCR